MQSLVEALEQAPQTPALALSILPDERAASGDRVVQCNAGAYPQDKLIHELFEEQVERTPDAVAVVYEGQSLTYARAQRRANQLARYLSEQGSRCRISWWAICVERSLEMVVGSARHPEGRRRLCAAGSELSRASGCSTCWRMRRRGWC